MKSFICGICSFDLYFFFDCYNTKNNNQVNGIVYIYQWDIAFFRVVVAANHCDLSWLKILLNSLKTIIISNFNINYLGSYVQDGLVES